MKLKEILDILGENPYCLVTRTSFEDVILKRNLDENSSNIFIDEFGDLYEMTKDDFLADDWVILHKFQITTTFHEFQRTTI